MKGMMAASSQDIQEAKSEAKAAKEAAAEAKLAATTVQTDGQKLKETTVTHGQLEEKICEVIMKGAAVRSMVHQIIAEKGPSQVSPNCIAVVGGLRGLDSSDEAEKWVRGKLAEWSLKAPMSYFYDVWQPRCNR